MKKQMGFLSGVKKSLKRIYHFPINQLGVFNLSQPNSKEANILFLGQNMDCKKAVISNLSDERLVQHQPTQYPTSEELSIGKIKFKAFDLGGHQIARRVWKDYYTKLGGFNPFRPKEVNILLLCQDMSCQAQMVLLFGDEWASMNSWVSIIGNIKYKFFYIGGPQIARRVWRDYGKMDAVVYIVNADAIIRARGRTEELNAELREQFAGPREDLIDLHSDEAFAEAPFLIFGVTFLEAFLNPKEKLHYFLELPSGEPSVTKELADADDRPLEVFWAKAGNKMQYLDGFKWLSQYM